MSLVGKKAPSFKAGAVLNGNEIGEINMDDFLGKEEILLFFYPKDFTFVCPTEILEFQKKHDEFAKRGVKVIGVSTDTEESHFAWLMTPKNKGGIEGVTYPLVADASKTVSMNYGILGGEYGYDEDDNMSFQGAPIAYRASFFIDKDGVVRHETVNFFPIGRNIDEYLRVIDAWHHNLEHGEVCPAGWNAGDDAMTPSFDGVADYLSKH